MNNNLFFLDRKNHLRLRKLALPAFSPRIMEQMKERYRELSLKYHPDRNISTDTTTKMTEINSAYEIIMEAMA